ncbi:MAG: MFS transporter, partial [Ilumatobacteraceae bacterium]
SGIASGVNNAMARVGALLAVAAVPMVAGFSPGVPVSPAVLVDGFHSVLLVAAALVAIGALGSWVGIRSTLLETGTPDDVTPIEDRPPCFHCGADAPPLVVHGGG